MSIGTWFAYCTRERLVSLDEVERGLKPDSDLSIVRAQDNLLVITVHDSMTGQDADITVNTDSGPHVALEAKELAGENLPVDPGVPPPDLDALARADARLELHWELAFSDETYNPMMLLAEHLVQACGAIIYDVTNHRFV